MSALWLTNNAALARGFHGHSHGGHTSHHTTTHPDTQAEPHTHPSEEAAAAGTTWIPRGHHLQHHCNPDYEDCEQEDNDDQGQDLQEP